MKLNLLFLMIFSFCLVVSATAQDEVYTMGNAFSNEAIAGWPASNAIDQKQNSVYSSNIFTSSSNTRGVILAAWLSAPRDINKLVLTARMYNGQSLGFPQRYDVYLTAPDNSKWNYIGNFANQPDSTGKVNIALSSTSSYFTYGVLIIPTVLGKDNYSNYFFQVADVQLGYQSPMVSSVINNASFVSQSVPAVMQAGKIYPVTVIFKNTGTTIWSKASSFNLGSQNPQDNNTWGVGRMYLTSSEVIRPGEQKSFTFNVTAPATAGIYNFQWRMLKEGVEWFGEYSNNLSVSIAAVNPGNPVVCSQLAAYNNLAIDASGVIQGCIDQTPNNSILYIPPGLYTVERQVKLNRPMIITTQGKRDSPIPCDLNNSTGCAEIRAGYNYSSIGVGFFNVRTDNFVLDHLIFNGNRLNRNPAFVQEVCQPDKTASGFNLGIAGKNAAFTNNVSAYAICGSSLAWEEGGSNVRIAGNTIAFNGVHNKEFSWADGLTIMDLKDSQIFYNKFMNNTDVDFIFGGCQNCTITFNQVIHDDAFVNSSFAGMMLHAWKADPRGWPGTSGNFTGADISNNSVECSVSKRCGYGFLIGGDPWYMRDVFGGNYHDNTVNNAQQGFTVAHANDIVISNNRVTNSGGTFFTEKCGYKNTDAYAVSLNSWNIATNDNPAVYYVRRNFPEGCLYNPIIEDPNLVNKSAFVAQNVPAVMTAGKTYPVTVVLRNTGTTNWSKASVYRLGSWNPMDNNQWAVLRVDLSPNEIIRPGEQKTFTFYVTAPTQSGFYNFQWRMLREAVEWFGDPSANVTISVTPAL